MGTGFEAGNDLLIWTAGNARLVEPDMIVLDKPETYLPGWEDLHMLFAFAGIERPADAVAFAERYGLLWNGPDAKRHRESIGEWQREADKIDWILYLYNTVRAAIKGNQQAIDTLRAQYHSQYPAEAILDDNELLAAASIAIGDNISDGLRAVSARVIAASAYENGKIGEFLFAPTAANLLGMLYHQLAILVVNRFEVRVCDGCGAVFPVHDKRQRYCTGACANRARFRRHVERKRAAERH